jgi:hypothetical protein
MTNPTIRIHDLETDKVLDRPMTASELKAYEASIESVQKRKDAEESKAILKQEVLAKLGLTSEEVSALLG